MEPGANTAPLDDFDTLPISALKERLTALRVRFDTCIEKRDFVALLRQYAKPGKAPGPSSSAAPKAAPSSASSAPSSSAPSSSSAPPKPSVRVPSRPVPASSPPPARATDNINWQSALLVLFLAYFVATKVFGLGGGRPWGEEYGGTHASDWHPGNNDYLKGKVIEVSTHEQFTQLLTHLKTTSGLPAVVDFYSPSCGPCVMIAPTFQHMAKEYAKRAVFIKINVNENGETSSAFGVRAMPTFIFIVNEKEAHRFSGADAGRLRQLTDAVVSMAEHHGTYVDKVVSPETLTAFYKEHDESKVSQVTEILAKHGDKTALLMAMLKHKYGTGPQTVAADSIKPKPAPQPEKDKPDATSLQPAPVDSSAPDQSVDAPEDLSVELFAAPPYTTNSGNAARPEKVVIIGGGPAGLSAAIYAARAGLAPLIIAPMFGGQLLGKGVDVENFPGVVGDHSTGRGLVSIMRLQAHGFNTRFANDAIVQLDTSARPFRISLNESQEVVHTHSIIFATGADSKWLGTPGEHEYRGHGVSSCATCDGFLFKDQHVVVIGGGDAAMEDALVLARTSSGVTLVHRGEKFRASHILSERVKSNPKIKILWQHVVTKFEGVGTEEQDKKLTKVTVKHVTSGKEQVIGAGAAFIAIGHSPNTGVLKGVVEMDEQGYIVTRGRSTKTSVDGIFAAGDVADKVYRQAVTSAGTGAAASLDAERWLSEHGLGIA